MRFFIAPLLAAGMLAGVPAAHAGGYVSFGIGPEAALGGELAARFQTEDLAAGRLGLGFRSKNLAIEAVAIGTGLDYMNGAGNGSADLVSASLGVDLKYHLHLILGLEGYGRIGLHRTWLGENMQEEAPTFEGSGHMFGGGLQYSFDVLPVIDAAVWVDFTRQAFDLTDVAQRPLSGTADLLTVGVSLGL